MSQPQFGIKPNHWAWAESDEADSWEGPFATREEAIAHGHRNEMRYGVNEEKTHYGYICEVGYPDAAGFVDVDDVLERMNEQDEVSWADDAVFTAREGAQEALREWARKYIRVERWCITGEPEKVEAPA